MAEVTLAGTSALPLATMLSTTAAGSDGAAPFASLLTALGEPGTVSTTPAGATTSVNPLTALLAAALPKVNVATGVAPAPGGDGTAPGVSDDAKGSDDDQAAPDDLSPDVQALLASLVGPAPAPLAAPLPIQQSAPRTSGTPATTLPAPVTAPTSAKTLPIIVSTASTPAADVPLPEALIAMIKQAAPPAGAPTQAAISAGPVAPSAMVTTPAAEAPAPTALPSPPTATGASPAAMTPLAIAAVSVTTAPTTTTAMPATSRPVDAAAVQAASASILPEAAAPREAVPAATPPTAPVSTTAALGARIVPTHVTPHAEMPRASTPVRTRRTSDTAVAGVATATIAPRAEATSATTGTTALPADDPVARQLTVAQDGQWLDTLARDIAGAGGSDGRLTFRLDPHHLGSLSVQIEQRADGASVRLVTATETARALLADAQPQLMAEARAQGLHLRDATVETRAPDAAPNPGNTPAPAPSAPSGSMNGGTRGDGGSLAGQLSQQQQQGQRGGTASQRAPGPQQPRTNPAPRTPARDGAELYA